MYLLILHRVILSAVISVHITEERCNSALIKYTENHPEKDYVVQCIHPTNIYCKNKICYEVPLRTL